MGAAEAIQHFRETTGDFLSEQVPLEETQAALHGLLDLADDEALMSEYASFIYAPLNSSKEQKAARSTLCHIMGNASTFKMKPNQKRIDDVHQRIMNYAESRWYVHDPATYNTFMSIFMAFVDPSRESQRRRQLHSFAASEKGLQDLLTSLFKEVDKYA
ncbi:hypothetical protein F5Y16DRAFT_76640 [Xylariaceae sp. FL0255]|nr:hypothetical protein F5Y16DRAFT_76640 [Xylariaceae sp. FL0255]